MTDEPVATPEPEATPTPEPEATPEPEIEPTEPEAEAGEEGLETEPEPEPEAPETEEVEFEGSKYKVPKALKGALMMHRDYTQKTQEVAEERRGLEQEREQFQQQTKTYSENLKDYARLQSIDQELDGFKNVDWDKAQEDDPDRTERAWRRYTLLRDQRSEVATRLQQKEQEATQAAQRDYAKALEKARSHAQTEIKDWSPELESKLVGLAESKNVSPDLVRQAAVTAPGTLELLYLAHVGHQFLERQRKAGGPLPKKPVEPAQKVKGGGTPSTGPRDEQKVDDWLAARNRQLEAKQKRRA